MNNRRVKDRRVNEKLAYHVRTAFPKMDRRSEIKADRRVRRGKMSFSRALLELPISEIWSRLILKKAV